MKSAGRWMVALLAGAMFLAPLPARAAMSDPESVAYGRTLGRSLLILRRATACAPVLLITQCLDDLKQFVGKDDGNERLAIIPNVGPKPYDRLISYILDGDRANIDPTLGWISTILPTPGADPHEQALKEAGIAATLYDAGGGVPRWQLDSLGALVAAAQLAKNDDLFAASERAAIGVISASNDARGQGIYINAKSLPSLLALDAAFAGRIDERYPAQPTRTFVFDRSAPGNLRLGIAFATIRELLEEPFISAIPEVRPLETQTCAHIVELTPGAADSCAALLHALVTNDPAARKLAITAFEAIGVPLIRSLGQPAAKQFALGLTVAQIGHSAATYRDSKSGEFVAAVRVLAKTAGLDAPTAALFDQLFPCGPLDFACQRHASRAIVEALVPPPTVRSSSIEDHATSQTRGAFVTKVNACTCLENV